MSQLICPDCESPKVQESQYPKVFLGKIRKCLSCNYTSVWFVSRDLDSVDYGNMNKQWKGWECVYILGSARLGSMLKSRELFNQNKIGE